MVDLLVHELGEVHRGIGLLVREVESQEQVEDA